MAKPFRLGRRTFLGTAGTVLALPWLEAMDTKEARANPQTFPVRFITFYMPIGACREGWNPTGTENSWALGSTVDPSDPTLYGMSPLEMYKQDVNVLLNVANATQGHVAGQATVLTGQYITQDTPGQDTSADQYVADYYESQPNKPNLRSLELGTNVLTNYTDGYNPIKVRPHELRMHGTPLAKEVDPQ